MTRNNFEKEKNKFVVIIVNVRLEKSILSRRIPDRCWGGRCKTCLAGAADKVPFSKFRLRSASARRSWVEVAQSRR